MTLFAQWKPHPEDVGEGADIFPRPYSDFRTFALVVDKDLLVVIPSPISSRLSPTH